MEAAKAETVVETVDGESSEVTHTNYDAPAVLGTDQPAPSLSEGRFSTFVSRVRVGEYPDKGRLVMELSGPVVYEIGEVDDKSVVFIDLPEVSWDAEQNWQGGEGSVIKGYSVKALPEGGTRVVVNGNVSMSVGSNGLLDPNGEKGHRLYVDLERVN